MLIINNKETDYQIIYPLKPSESELFAAKELAAYIFKLTGAAMTYFRDDRRVLTREIVIGYTNRGGVTEAEKAELGDEGYIIRADGERLFIAGSGVRGALYGVYAFLEQICGCRFYTKDFERVPYSPSLEIPGDTYICEKPVFEYRNSYWCSLATSGICAKLKLNGDHGRDRFPACLGGDAHYNGGFEHTIGWLTEQCKYGERAWTQPCLTDEENYRKVIKNIRWLLKKEPDARLVSITQNDGLNGACQCERCRKINEAEGSDMGTMLSFVNRVADELGPEYPNLSFDTFAYRTTKYPPKTLRPRKNVIIRLCSIEYCFRHPLDECSETPGHPDVKESFSDLVRRWAKIAPKLYIWDYTTDFTNFSVLYPNFEALRRNSAFFAENNVRGVFEQGNIASPNGEFGELRGYLLAKLLWNPYMTAEEYNRHMNEFICDYYGAGGKYIADYLKMALDGSRDSHFNIYFDDASVYVRAPGVTDEREGRTEFVRIGNELFDAAEAAADSDTALAHIRRSRIQLFDYEDFTIRYLRNGTEGEKYDELTRRLHELSEKRFMYMRRYGVVANREFYSIEGLSEPDFEQHALLWSLPEDK